MTDGFANYFFKKLISLEWETIKNVLNGRKNQLSESDGGLKKRTAVLKG